MLCAAMMLCVAMMLCAAVMLCAATMCYATMMCCATRDPKTWDQRPWSETSETELNLYGSIFLLFRLKIPAICHSDGKLTSIPIHFSPWSAFPGSLPTLPDPLPPASPTFPWFLLSGPVLTFAALSWASLEAGCSSRTPSPQTTHILPPRAK